MNIHLMKGMDRIKRRGPDQTRFEHVCDGIGMGFHRLAINDLTDAGMQPMTFKGVTVICNGEIYNYKALAKQFNIKLTTTCDCEIIAKLYDCLDGHMMELLQLLDGVFAIVLYDSAIDVLYTARDVYGIRPLYMGINANDGYAIIASESKAMVDYSDKLSNIGQLNPGSLYSIDTNDFSITYRVYYDHSTELGYKLPNTDTSDRIYELLTDAVRKRLMSDRPVGFLLSGGLDSSLITGIAAKLLRIDDDNKVHPIHTYCIGMEGGTDLAYARKVADYIGSIHHEVIVSEDDFFNAIPDVIEAIESYDITTVRASVGNYLIGKYIKEHTDQVVIFNGDGSDEMGGYRYLQNAPNADEFQKECINLLTNIHYFDVLRSDRCLSSHWGLETRTPFLDKRFVEFYMSIDPSEKMWHNGTTGMGDIESKHVTNNMEKMPLRKAFEGKDIIPDEVLWRRKEAFSDGCSSESNSWHKIIKRRLSNLCEQGIIETNDEGQYYKNIYNKLYTGFPSPIPHYWMPKWVNTDQPLDPSARELSVI
jgi:asparagine synthase (glutamine-hydrolysing)